MSEEKKSYYSESQNKATQRYLEKNMEAVRFWAKKGEKDRYKKAAAAAGQSLAAFITAAINEKIARDGLEGAQIGQEYRPEGQAAEDHVTAKQPAAAPFTEEERAKIDLDKLQHDIMYQFAVRDAYGEAVLSDLLKEARAEK